MEKYLMLLVIIVIQTSLGGIYAWSALSPALSSNYNLTAAQTQWIFGLSIAALTLAMIPAGSVLDRRGPRLTAAVGGLLFAAGYFLASKSQGNFLSLMIGIGLLGGAGTGFGYICPLAVALKRFPRHRGLVTGLAVAGFGGGGVILSSLAAYLLNRGVDILNIFRIISLTYGPLIIISAMFLSFPRSFGQPASKIRLQISDLLVRGDLRLLAAGMFAGTFAGLLVVGNLKPIALESGVSSAAAITAINLFALGNAAGRIIWGAAYDHWHDKALPVALALIGVSVLLLVIPDKPLLFILTSTLIGFSFGSCFVLYAARIATVYGVDSVAGIYPLIFLFYGLAGITGPVAGGFLFDLTQSYLPGVLAAAIIAGLGALYLFPMAIKRPD